MSVLVDLVGDRLRNGSWVVVFKGLIVSHNLMSLGNEVGYICVFHNMNVPCVFMCRVLLMIRLNRVKPFMNELLIRPI